jgi:hypothetical protein
MQVSDGIVRSYFIIFSSRTSLKKLKKARCFLTRNVCLLFTLSEESATNGIKMCICLQGSNLPSNYSCLKRTLYLLAGLPGRPEVFSILTQNQSQAFGLDLVFGVLFFSVSHCCS